MAYFFFLNRTVFIPSAPATFPYVRNIYGTLADANTYFDARLHEQAWADSSAEDRPKALWAATMIIDALNYKGEKNTVYTLLEDDPSASDEDIRAAEVNQPLEFPRGSDIEVPEIICMACYEIAHALLDGIDPDLELENLGVAGETFSSVRTTYSRTQISIEHLINGVPRDHVWQWLKPFLRDSDIIELSRVG